MLDQAKVDTERHLYEREYWIKVGHAFCRREAHMGLHSRDRASRLAGS